MFGRSKRFPLMTCIIKVDTSSLTWQTTVKKVLKNIRSVRRFKMDEYGVVEVTGTVNTEKLVNKLAKAGNQATLCWYTTMPIPTTDDYIYYYDDHLYGGDGTYYSQGYEYGGTGWSSLYDGDYDCCQGNDFPPKHAHRPFASLAREFRQSRAPPRMPTQTVVYNLPRSFGDGVGCCSVM